MNFEDPEIREAFKGTLTLAGYDLNKSIRHLGKVLADSPIGQSINRLVDALVTTLQWVNGKLSRQDGQPMTNLPNPMPHMDNYEYTPEEFQQWQQIMHEYSKAIALAERTYEDAKWEADRRRIQRLNELDANHRKRQAGQQ